jgi:uncharacterized protein (TIGR02246 family)
LSGEGARCRSIQTGEANMQTDEQAIRELVADWISASKAGDTKTVLGLMTDDVVFLLAGYPPMHGKKAFAAANADFKPFKFDAVSEVEELKVFGDWAYLWTSLSVSVVPTPGAAPITRRGNTLSILKKQDGKWLLFRDANMLAPVPE